MSVRPSVLRPSVCTVLFSNDEYGRFEGKKSPYSIINDDIMFVDEVAASDVPPWYFFIHSYDDIMDYYPRLGMAD